MSEFAPGDFLVVKVFGKKSFRLYVVKVLYPEVSASVNIKYLGKTVRGVPLITLTSTWVNPTLSNQEF